VTFAAFAVLAAIFMAAAVLLAAPAWSKDEQTKKDSARTADTKTQEGSSRERSKASGEDENKASGNDKSEAQESANDPIAGAGHRPRQGR